MMEGSLNQAGTQHPGRDLVSRAPKPERQMSGMAEWQMARAGRISLFPQPGADGVQDPLLIREFPGFQLGVNQVPVDGQLKGPTAGRNQGQVAYLLLVRAQELVRQTDGLRLVVSHRAILEFQVHFFSFHGRVSRKHSFGQRGRLPSYIVWPV